jgi:hypothetical protein
MLEHLAPRFHRNHFVVKKGKDLLNGQTNQAIIIGYENFGTHTTP